LESVSNGIYRVYIVQIGSALTGRRKNNFAPHCTPTRVIV
jgi:hypothetical protein